MNRLISRLIFSFALLSLLAVLAPLVQSGAGTPLLPFLGRDKSLLLYASFLLVFFLLVLPGFMAKGPLRRPPLAFGAVAAYLLVFAAIPLIFCAYISGVSAAGLLPLSCLCAAGAGMALLLRRLAGARSAFPSYLLGSLLLFVLPGVQLYLTSVGERPLDGRLAACSPLLWVYRMAVARQVPELLPFILAAVIPWGLALLPLRRPKQAAGLLLLGVAAFCSLAAGGRPQEASGMEGVEVESLAGGLFRPGFRIPLRVRIPGRGERVVVRVGAWSRRIVADGRSQVILPIPGPEDRSLVVERKSGREVLLLPLEPAAKEQRLVGFFGISSQAPPPLSQGVTGVALDVKRLPFQAGALEFLDGVALTAQAYQELAARRRRQLLRYAALGGRLLVLDKKARQIQVQQLGVGSRLTLPPAALGRLSLEETLPGHRSVLDSALIQTFASPRWQEMDLSKLLIFALLYHLAFLLAFLLPLLMDSRKSVGVYLVSVGFVVLAVALLAWNVLQDIFLKETQVYTQAITILAATPGEDSKAPPLLVGRQFLCFASMSSERRDLSFSGQLDLVPYRPRQGAPSLLLGAGPKGPRLLGVALDRRQKKVLLRLDRVGASPVRLLPTGDPRAPFRLEPEPGVADPWGLLLAHSEDALLMEGHRWARRFRLKGWDLVPVDPGEGAPGLPREGFLRKLLGAFIPPWQRYLVVRFSGIRRPDQTDHYLWVRDLGAFLVLPLP